MEALSNSTSDLVLDKEGMGNLILEYFTDLFSTSSIDYLPVVNLVVQQVIQQDNDRMLAPFSAEEFKRVIMQMHPDQSLRLDGMDLAFFRNSSTLWMIQLSLVATMVTSRCLSFFSDSNLARSYF